MSLKDPPKRFFILVVEDSVSRYKMFLEMFPSFARVIWTILTGPK